MVGPPERRPRGRGGTEEGRGLPRKSSPSPPDFSFMFHDGFDIPLFSPYFHPIFTLFSRAVLEQFLLFHGQRRPRGAKNHEKNSYKENSIDSLFTMFIFVDFGENFLRLNDYKFASVFDIPLFSPYFHPILGNYRFCLLPWAVTFPLGAAAWDRGVPSPFLSKNGKNRPPQVLTQTHHFSVARESTLGFLGRTLFPNPAARNPAPPENHKNRI